MNAGGFDCVIGNPPYVLLQNMQSDETQLSYLKSRYAVCAYKIDTYHLFLEKATSQTRLGGSFGFIVPNTFLRNQHAVQLRSILLAETNIELIRLFDYPVFAGASVDTTVIVATRKSRPIAESRVRLFRSNKIGTCAELTDVAQSQWEKHSRREFLLGGEEVGDNIRSKIESRSFVLGEIATAYFGIQTFDRDKYVSDTKVDARYRPVVDGVNIRRYVLSNSSEFVMFTPRAIKSGGKEAVYKQSRIGVRQIGQVPIATWLPAEIYTLNTIYNIFIVKPTKFRLQFVLAVINSAVTRWYWRQQFFDQKRTFPKIKKPDLLAIRIPALKLDVEEGKVPHDRLSTLTENMIRFHAEIAVAKSAAQQSILQRQINATDAEIDRLVYDLYGLSPAEIAIVEGNTAANATTAE
jgi:hypothetical protein